MEIANWQIHYVADSVCCILKRCIDRCKLQECQSQSSNLSTTSSIHHLWPAFYHTSCCFPVVLHYWVAEAPPHSSVLPWASQVTAVCSHSQGTRESHSIIFAEAKSLITYCNLKCLNTDTSGFPCSRKVLPSQSL